MLIQTIIEYTNNFFCLCCNISNLEKKILTSMRCNDYFFFIIFFFFFRWNLALLFTDEDTWLVSKTLRFKKCPNLTGSSLPIQLVWVIVVRLTRWYRLKIAKWPMKSIVTKWWPMATMPEAHCPRYAQTFGCKHATYHYS